LTGNRINEITEKDLKRYDFKYKIAGTSNPYRCITASLQIAGFTQILKESANESDGNFSSSVGASAS
jgi:hypothetical protein